MSDQNQKWNILIGISLIVVIIGMIISLIYLPFVVKEYSVLENDYLYKTYFFGYWKHFLNGELWDQGGLTYLTRFTILSPILIIIALMLSLILIPSLVFIRKPDTAIYTKQKRSIGIAVFIVGLVGIIGVLLQVPFISNFKEANPEGVVGIGFTICILYFIALSLIGLPLAILSRPLTQYEQSNIQLASQSDY